jgi:hypothetical protein
MDIFTTNLFVAVFSFKNFTKMIITNMFPKHANINTDCCKVMKIMSVGVRAGSAVVALKEDMANT